MQSAILVTLAILASATAEGMVFIGRLSEKAHDISGNVLAVSPRTLLLTDFTYDGLGPDAFFMIGTFGTPEANAEDGIILSYPYDGNSYSYFDQQAAIIGNSFVNEDVMLQLPSDITMDQVAWFSIWCRQFSLDFGSVIFPPGLDFSSLEMTASARPVTSTRRPVIIIPGTVEFESVGGGRGTQGVISDCFSFTKGDQWTIVEGILEGFAATLILPRFGQMISFTLPNAALMVEAWSNNSKYLGRLSSTDKRTWTLDLGEEQEIELILQFIVRFNSDSARLDSLAIDGRNVLCDDQGIMEAPRRQDTVPQTVTQSVGGAAGHPSCVEVDMAVYGQNVEVENDVDSPLACWELCQTTPRCRYWNHNMYSSRTRKVGRCHIKKGRGKRPGTVSGYTFGARDCRPN